MAAAFWQIRSDPLGFLTDSWQRYGDVVQFPVPRPPSYLVNDPAAVRHVLQGNHRNYDKHTLQYSALSLVTGEGLLTAPNDVWRARRRLVQPAFHADTLSAVAAHVDVAVTELASRWRRVPAGFIVDVDEAMMRLALQVVGRALFGADLSGDAAVLVRATLDALDVVIARARMPIWAPESWPTPSNRKLATALRDLDAAVSAILARRRGAAVGVGGTSAPGPVPVAKTARGSATPPDMLDLLLAAHDEDGRGLSARAVRDEIVTFIVAGHETVASALTWAWALLADAPEQSERLAAEAREVLGDGPVTIEAYPQLSFARSVFEESLRLYPPAWLITRDALGDDVLAGRFVPAGSLLILSPWLLHRHPQLWSAPGSFDPDRFSPTRRGSTPREAFIPFGAGPRMCIGRDFAYVEGVLLLSALAREFEFRPLPDHKVVAAPLVTVRPADGLPMRLWPRR